MVYARRDCRSRCLAMAVLVGVQYLLLSGRCCKAFSPSSTANARNQRIIPLSSTTYDTTSDHRRACTMVLSASRRDFITAAASGAVSVIGLDILRGPSFNSIAHAATTTTTTSEAKVFAIDKNFSVDDAKKRFQAARKDVRYLLDNYSEISNSKNGGDNVRNYLGTQGVNSNLFGIQKVLKILKEESKDIVEFTEAMDEFNAYYYQAEGAAYQSLFVEHSSAKGTTESLLATAKKDLIQMEKYMDILASQLQ